MIHAQGGAGFLPLPAHHLARRDPDSRSTGSAETRDHFRRARAHRRPSAPSRQRLFVMLRVGVKLNPVRSHACLAVEDVMTRKHSRTPPPRKRLLTPRQPTCVAWTVDEDGWARLGQVAASPRGCAGWSVDAFRRHSAAAAPSDRVGRHCSRLGAVGQVESGVDGARRRALRKTLWCNTGPRRGLFASLEEFLAGRYRPRGP
jgi:hypothetical protein